jgi:hypothetical protein
MHDTVTAAKRSIEQVHELIQTIFTGDAAASEAALQQLMPLFAEDFSMVTTAGQIASRSQVEQMFRRGAGGRPGLVMEVAEMEAVWHSGAHIAMRYQETHRLNGVATSRRSVVLLTCAESAVRWNYLHETALG